MNNIFRAVIGLEPENDMTLEHKLFAAPTAVVAAAGAKDLKA